MSHGLQIVDEHRAKGSSEWITLEVSTIKYLPLTDSSMWDTVHGIRFFLTSHWVDGGGGSLTITVEGANDPNAATAGWATISTAALTPAVGTAAVPIETQFEVAPLVSAAASRFTSLPPFMRMKFVTAANSVAAIHRVSRTMRGLS
jgi:hypothetical protein